MRVKTKTIEPKVMRLLKGIGRAADRKGHQVYLVGGCVRDLLLGRENLDVDIVLEKDAPVLAKQLAKELKVKVTVYPRFGTATLFSPGGRQIDLATTRSEHYPRPGALPVVKAGDLKQDLFRRDFTINTLAMSLSSGNFGEIVDLFKGVEDLKAKRIRVLHDKSFIDDPTRILRAVRFEQRFGFVLERSTRRLLAEALRKNTPTTVHPGRLFDEFRKTLNEPLPGRTILRLNRLGGIRSLFPDLSISSKVLSTLDRSLRKLTKHPSYRAEDKPLIYLAGVFWSSDKDQVLEASRHLRLTKKEKSVLLALVKLKGMRRPLAQKGLLASRVYEQVEGIPDCVLLFLKTVTNSSNVRKNLDRYFKKTRGVRLFICGEDVLRAGVSSGRKVGRILKTVLIEKIDGKIKGRKAELACVYRLAAGKE